MYNGPVRDGARGGRDQFNWESVKADKDREYYIGHSVKATVGRWQKLKDPYWYIKEKRSKDIELAAEIQAVQSKENDIMLEALGIKKKEKVTSEKPNGFGSKLEAHEVKELLRKENGESVKVESQRGLGFRHGAIGGIEKCERLDGFGINGGQEISSKKLEEIKIESDKKYKRKKRDKDEKNCKIKKYKKKHDKKQCK